MNSDNYALHLAQKYRLAISIAILKIKPESLTIDEYLQQIKNIINTDDDINISTCSDDFNIDSPDMINDFNDQDYMNQNRLSHDGILDNNINEVVIGAPENFDKAQNNYRNDGIGNADANIQKLVKGTLEDFDRTQNKFSILHNDNRNDSNKNNDNDNRRHVNDEINKIVATRVNHNTDNDKVIETIVINDSPNCNATKNVNRTIDNDENTNYKVQIHNGRDLNSVHNIEESNTNIDVNRERRDKFREVIQALKGADVVARDKVNVNENKKQAIRIQEIPFDPTDLDLTQCYNDDDTFFASLDILNNLDRPFIGEHSQNNPDKELEGSQGPNCEKGRENVETTSKNEHEENYLSQSLINTSQNRGQNVSNLKKKLPIEELTVINPKIPKVTDARDKIVDDDLNATKMTCNNSLKVHDNKNQNERRELISIVTIDTQKTYTKDNTVDNYTNITKNLASNNGLEVHDNKDQNKRREIIPIMTDTQKTYADTQSNTYYSESQINNIFIDKNLIYGKNKNYKNVDISKNMQFNINSQNCHDIFDSQNQNIENNTALSVSQNNNAYPSNASQACKNFTENDNAYPNEGFLSQKNTQRDIDFQTNAIRENFTENDTIILEDKQKTDSLYNNTQSTEKHCTYFDKTFNSDKDCSVNKNDSDKGTVSDKNLNKGCTIYDETVTDSNKTDENQHLEERIPFKIIGEMNKIKTYLNKRKELHDSGYTSSQSKCSFKSTQSTSTWVGESANSVFIYLTSCSLLSTTQEITEQISEVLGQLIDKLHEEEIYPTFLEELLNTVQKLLKSIYEDENYEFDVLLKKDEQIQRILLLNKSSHIKKYTIEKINEILEKLVDETSGNEISNINKIENICYIFHILQIIIPKFNLTQNSQNSQERILKKKEISDVWRKKWIANFKEQENVCSSEEKCVLKECSAILNKIIVNFVDGYSLIAFSALKCFNLMQ